MNNLFLYNNYPSNKLNYFDLFNLSRDLFNEYSTTKFDRELTESYIKILTKYGSNNINIKEISTIRVLYNNIIKLYYPNEIIIKAAFINNVILKTEHHVTIFELNAGTSRLDLCKINNSSIAYEIKTDLDNLKRLKKQINDYLKIFEKVFIICSKSKINNIAEKIPNECGIYSYRTTKTGKYIFKLEKNAKKSENINPLIQLNLLTKKQLLNILNLNTNNTKSDLIKQIIKKYKTKQINKIFKEQIKTKYKTQWAFIKKNHDNLLEIDYQWFFKNNIPINLIYK